MPLAQGQAAVSEDRSAEGGELRFGGRARQVACEAPSTEGDLVSKCQLLNSLHFQA